MVKYLKINHSQSIARCSGDRERRRFRRRDKGIVAAASTRDWAKFSGTKNLGIYLLKTSIYLDFLANKF